MEQDTGELVMILETRDQGMIAMGQSLLDAQSIEYAMKNQFVLGSVLDGVNTGIQLWVRPEDADKARLLLSDLAETAETAETAPFTDQSAVTESDSPTDLSSIRPPSPEAPFFMRLLWLIGLLLVPLVLVIVYSLTYR